MKYAISACLLGVNCKYNGGNNFNQEVYEFLKDKDYIQICPEVLGGLPTPRACCEIINGKIMNTNGEDCTDKFLYGATLALDKIKEQQVDIVILQPRSPSCGKGKIYDGNFCGKLIQGDGVFTILLEKNGIQSMTWEEFSSSSIKEP